MLQELSPLHAGNNAAIKVTVALNKLDLINPKSLVPPIVEDVKRLLAHAPHCSLDNIFLVCALSDRSHGVPDLARYLMSLAKLQPWLHSSSTVSTSTLESVVVEMIRERLFYHIRQEVPYSCSVLVQECRKFEEDDGRFAVQASASIMVKKALHKVHTL